MEYKHLSENLKKYRKKAKLTQKELAKKILKSEISIRKYESGTVNIPPPVLIDLCNALNVTDTLLLGEDKDKYFSENFKILASRAIDNTEKALKKYNEHKLLGESLKNELLNITSKPNYLLGAILDFLETTECYFTFLSIYYPEYNENKDIKVEYFTDEQINNIVSKITDLVKYEIYKIENDIK